MWCVLKRRTTSRSQGQGFYSPQKTNALLHPDLDYGLPCYLEQVAETIPVGLTSAQAQKLASELGPNELARQQRPSFLRRVLKVLSEPMLLLLAAAGVVTIFVAEPLDALVLLAMILLVVSITVYQQGRAEKALAALKDMTAPEALVLRDGDWVTLAARDLVVGDVVKVGEGDRIPADIEIVESSHLKVDESSLTGESIAVDRVDGETILAGTLVVAGDAVGVVSAIGVQTELGQISSSLSAVKQDRTRLQQEIAKLVKVIALIAATAAIAITLVLFFSRGDLAQALLSGIATAMAMIPEEFPVVLALFFALGAWKLSKDKVLARKSSVIETLGSATVICTDKTGTLTMNQMSVDALVPKTDESTLSIFGGLASRSDSYDPVDKAFLSLLGQQQELVLVRHYPLTPELTAMTFVWERGDEWVIACKGAPESVAEICGIELAGVVSEVEKAATGGRRVIGVAGVVVPKGIALPESQLDFDLEYQGLVALRDPIRPGVIEAVDQCHQAGIRVIMITGDYLGTAMDIAQEIGLSVDSVITGSELENLSDEELQERVKTLSVCARVKPMQKLRLVKALRANNEVVAMTGDGVNDAPALKLADISIAMGLRGTDVAKEASNLVITDDDFSSIVRGIRRGRTLYEALRKSFSYIVAIHIPLLGMAIIPVLFFDWPLVLIPAMVAFIELVVDPACTIVFQAEPGEPGLMKKPPRPTGQKLFDPKTLTLAMTQGFFVLGATTTIYFLALIAGREEQEVRTLTFAMLVLGNVFLILVNRSWTLTIIETLRHRRNPTVKWIVGAAVIVLIALVEIPQLSQLFLLGEISVLDWLVVLLAVLLSVSWFEIYKLLSRRSKTWSLV